MNGLVAPGQIKREPHLKFEAMVEILSEKTSFSNKEDSLTVSSTVCLVNLRRLQLEKEVCLSIYGVYV